MGPDGWKHSKNTVYSVGWTSLLQFCPQRAAAKRPQYVARAQVYRMGRTFFTEGNWRKSSNHGAFSMLFFHFSNRRCRGPPQRRGKVKTRHGRGLSRCRGQKLLIQLERLAADFPIEYDHNVKRYRTRGLFRCGQAWRATDALGEFWIVEIVFVRRRISKSCWV